MRSVPPKLDAELISFLHDLPDGATEAIGKLMSAAAVAGSKKATRASWISLAVQSVIIGGLVVGGALKLGNVATKSDVATLEQQIQQELNSRSSSQEMVTMRIAALEKGCDAAIACCAHQADRLDNLTRPQRLGPY